MNYTEKIKSAWLPIGEAFNQSPAMQKLTSGTCTVEHYKSVLRQIFHHTRENPQIQALATVYFRGSQRDLVKKFFQHATSEIGHDQLALNDLALLGEDVSRIPFERPLPATTALLAYPFYQIQYLNHLGYLGYLFHLEFAPTQHGAAYMSLLSKIGVPENAMTFLYDHSTIDVAHNKLMEIYIQEMVKTEEDFETVIYAMKVTAKLYSNMLQEAFEQTDNPQDWGISSEELHFSSNADKKEFVQTANFIRINTRKFTQVES